MDREAWRAAVQGAVKSWTRLGDWTELNWQIKQRQCHSEDANVKKENGRQLAPDMLNLRSPWKQYELSEKMWESWALVVDEMKRMTKMSWDGRRSEKTENAGESKPTTHHFPLIKMCRDCALPLMTISKTIIFLSNKNFAFFKAHCCPAETTFSSLFSRLARSGDLSLTKET